MSRFRGTLLIVMALAGGCTVVSGGADLHVEDDEGGNGTPTKSIACGSITCTDVCCGGGDYCTTDFGECLNPDNGHGFYMTCDGPEDCAAGQACCTWVGAIAAGGTDCMDDCSSNPMGEIACHDAADCPVGMTCAPSAYQDIFVPTLLGCR